MNYWDNHQTSLDEQERVIVSCEKGSTAITYVRYEERFESLCKKQGDKQLVALYYRLVHKSQIALREMVKRQSPELLRYIFDVRERCLNRTGGFVNDETFE